MSEYKSLTEYFPNKKGLAFLIIFIFILFAILVCVSYTPIATWSADSIPYGYQKRNMSTPSSRLVGHWISENGDHHIFYSLIDRSLQIGTYQLSLNSYKTKSSDPIKFKIISEKSSGTRLVIREFPNNTKLEATTGLDLSKSDIVCCISKDGKSMSQEYKFLEKRHLSIYHYVDGRVDPSSGFIPDHLK